MKKRKGSTEKIIGMLRESEGDSSILALCNKQNSSDRTFYRWRKKYGQMEVKDAKGLKELEKENTQLKKIVADQ